MGPVSALVLLAVIWWMTFFVVLPLKNKTQGEDGAVVPGTHKSAPVNFQFKQKAWLTTLWAVPIWIVIAGVILSGMITVSDIEGLVGGPPPLSQ